MFSRFHHRRGPSTSTPTSPVPPADSSTWEPASSAAVHTHTHDKHAIVAQQPVSSSNTSNMPLAAPPPAASKASKGTASKDLTTASSTSAASAASASTPAANTPPSLPPISRMSVLTVPPETKHDLAQGSKADAAQSRPSYSAPPSSLDTRRPSATKMASPQPPHESPQAQPAEPAFIGGLALANLNLRRSNPQDLSAAAAAVAAAASAEAKRPTSSTYSTSPPAPTTTSPASYSTSERRMSRQKAPPPPINTSLTSRQHLSPTVGSQPKDARPGSRSATSFVTPTDLQSSAAAAAAASAINAANDVHNMAVPASVNSSAATAAVAASARTKKSRPFLKNPVSSLLGRRKTTASTPDTAPWAASKTDTDVPVYVPFRGTRVHDFSAPRQPRIVTNDPPVSASTAAAAAAAAVANSAGLTNFSKTATPRQPPAPSPNPSLRPQSADGPALSQAVPQTTSSHSSAAVTPDPNGYASAPQAYVAPFPSVPTAQKTDLRTGPERTLSQGTLQTLQENDTISFEDKPERPSMEADAAAQAQGLGHTEPALAQAASIRAPSTSTHSRVASADVSSILKSSPSTGTTRSRNVSISDLSPNSNAGGQPSTSATTPGSVVSALPKHMKSTSSRFSFMVGSSEEKVLEERHRQKQAEKATNTDARDSRYYDSDEEDYDYEAMMDEDDFEDDAHLYGDDDEHVGLGDRDFLNPTSVAEPAKTAAPIDDDDDAYKSEYEDAVTDPGPAKPGIEIEDDDPEGLDPNNDQENFAGFVFQRSNPASSLVTPTSAAMLVTPRDATGRVIGFAMTKDTTPDLNPPSAKSLSPMDPGLLNAVMESHGNSSEMSPEIPDNADVGGLGIQHTALEEKEEDDYRATENLDDYDAESDYGEPTVTVQHVSDPFDNEQYGQPLPEQPVPVQREDELYFDQGLADELDFGAPDNSVPFDENLFDLPDTDRFGRPLPGVFAAAQAAQRNAMAAAVEAAAGRQPLPVSESAAAPAAAAAQTQEISTSTSLRRQLPPIMTDAERVAAYQAALSEAAFKAAAQGKFRRDSESNASDMDFMGRASPPPTTSPPVIEHDVLIGTAVGLGLSYGAGESAIKNADSVRAAAPVATGVPSQAQSDITAQSHLAYAFTSHREDEYQHNFEEDDYLEDMDDYDFDDDIIAEANAEALANDMDGFYGQEFNFYSAPTNQGPSAKDTPQFAHGGYFIPQGIGRSISGRVNVSREPNLTPITERSEYSNRNSVMSLALPPYGSSAELRSPGLAQLALIADDNDMSLSALLRLRSKTFGGGSQVSSREGSPMLIPPGGLSFPGSAPPSASASALGFDRDRDRDRGDRENASSPYDQHLTPAQLQLLQKQYALPASHYQHHHRMNSVTSQRSRGAGSSDYNSEGGGSDCGSPTLTNLQAITSIDETLPPMPPIPQSLPLSPIPASSCTPVLEEEGESGAAGLREPSSTTNDLSASALSGHSSGSGSGLWIRSPVTGSLNSRHSKQNSEQQIQDLQHQLQLKERENELIQRENEKMQQRILALEQKSAASER